LRHTMSEETFRVATAYLNLIGAQESVKSFEESMARQNQIAQLTQRRIAAGDLPAIETARTQARSNSVAAPLSQARSKVGGARGGREAPPCGRGGAGRGRRWWARGSRWPRRWASTQRRLPTRRWRPKPSR